MLGVNDLMARNSRNANHLCTEQQNDLDKTEEGYEIRSTTPYCDHHEGCYKLSKK